MVDKNLHNLLASDHKLWLGIFHRCLNHKAHCVQRVKDPLYPCLNLWKSHLHGIPVHHGILRGDVDDARLPFGFDACFTAYVRRAFALMFGTRCGMCGCRYRHEPYWSLRMRVCKLCMEANTISPEELCHTYGVDYSDLILRIKGSVFYCTASNSGSDDRVRLQSMRAADLRMRNFTYLFWMPHLSVYLDFTTLARRQVQSKAAASVLSGVFRRAWIAVLRRKYAAGERHIDCLLLHLKRNERRRITNRYGLAVVSGGPSWAFPERAHSGNCKFSARNYGRLMAYFYRTMETSEDCVV